MHVLVIPKGRWVSIADFAAARRARPRSPGSGARSATVARQLGLEAPGYRLLANMGEHGGQEVAHLHVHLFGGRPLGRMLERQPAGG